MRTAAKLDHDVRIVAGGAEIYWTEYSFTNSLLEPADDFSFTTPWSPEVWGLFGREQPLRIVVDGSVRMQGFAETRDSVDHERSITITGRSKEARLVDESAPEVNYDGLLLSALVAKAVAPWFPKVVLSNARNRKVARGRGHKVRDSNKVYVDSVGGTRIDPGQKRWQLIQELLDQPGYVGWGSADGQEFVIGQPDYDQEIQFAFRSGLAAGGSDGTATRVQVKDSTADRFSKVMVLGSGRGTDGNYGAGPSSRAGIATDGAGVDGVGGAFLVPKRLVISNRDDVRSRKDAQDRAEREKARGDMYGHHVTVTTPGHGQVYQGGAPTLFTCDTLARLVDPRVPGGQGVYVLAEVTMAANRDNGETSTLGLLPKGTQILW